jgi:hypothetical protein
MAYTFDEKIVSDLHKDARGFRPSEYFWEEWTQCGDDNRQAMWDSLLRELEETMAEDRRREAQALADFGQQIIDNINRGADSIESAIRWILEAEGIGGYDLHYGADYVAFHFGLSYQNSFKDQITAAIKAMENLVDSTRNLCYC